VTKNTGKLKELEKPTFPWRYENSSKKRSRHVNDKIQNQSKRFETETTACTTLWKTDPVAEKVTG
jgi:hypothetical protein